MPTYSKTWSEATKILQVWKASVSVAIRSFSIEDMIIRGKHTLIQQHQPEVFSQFVAHFHGSGRILVSGPGSPSSGSAHHYRSLGGYTCRVQVPHHTPMFPQFLSPLQAPSLHHNGQRRRPQQVSRNWWHLGIVCGVESVLENLWLKHEILTTHSIYRQIISNTHDVPHIGTLGG